jgi:hypothetical protein
VQGAGFHPRLGQEPRRPGCRGEALYVVARAYCGLPDGRQRVCLPYPGLPLEADDLVAAHDDLLEGRPLALTQGHVPRGRYGGRHALGEGLLCSPPGAHPLDVLRLPAECLLGLQALHARLVQHDAGELPALLPPAHFGDDGLEGRPA